MWGFLFSFCYLLFLKPVQQSLKNQWQQTVKCLYRLCFHPGRLFWTCVFVSFKDWKQVPVKCPFNFQKPKINKQQKKTPEEFGSKWNKKICLKIVHFFLYRCEKPGQCCWRDFFYFLCFYFTPCVTSVWELLDITWWLPQKNYREYNLETHFPPPPLYMCVKSGYTGDKRQFSTI